MVADWETTGGDNFTWTQDSFMIVVLIGAYNIRNMMNNYHWWSGNYNTAEPFFCRKGWEWAWR